MKAIVARTHKDGVIPERAVFYARGGGKPADHGMLSWEDTDGGEEARVVDVCRGEDGNRYALEGSRRA